jgi:DNA-directed RNA polymerase specialized sigma24 family protein
MQDRWNDPRRHGPTSDNHAPSNETSTPEVTAASDAEARQGATYQPSARDTLRVAELVHAWGEEISDPLLHVLSVVEVEEVRRIVVGLPERQRTVISLRSFGGLSKDGVGALLELPVAEVTEIETSAFEAVKAHLSAETRIAGAVAP